MVGVAEQRGCKPLQKVASYFLQFGLQVRLRSLGVPAGVRSPWRFCILYYGGHAGLAGANGNNNPSNTNWNGVPRISFEKIGCKP